jgi:hypothetical protein
MDRTQYLDRNNWLGPCYELAIEYYPGGNDARLLNALNAAWNERSLDGPWLSPDGFLGTDRMPETLDDTATLYGLLTLADGKTVGCRTNTHRERDVQDGSDWLEFSVPIAMLNVVYPMQLPLTHLQNHWLDCVDDALVKIGQLVYESYPFNLALVGEEVTGQKHEQSLFASDMKRGSYLFPPILFERIRPSRPSEVLPGGLRWFSACNMG